MNARTSIPCRADNPFATCWTKPGVLPFGFSAGQNAKALVEQLASFGWHGQIVGPHGSGKTSMLAALWPELQNATRTIVHIQLRNGTRHLPASFFDALCAQTNPLAIVDGYEQLGWIARLRLRWICHRYSAGLLVTTHRKVWLPVLAALCPSRVAVQRLVDQLLADRDVTIPTGDIAASFDRHNGNVREIFFDLYDQYERNGRRR